MADYFPEEILERIRQESDIVGLVSQYVSLKKSGQSLAGLCPFHSEKTPSFMVNPAKQVFHCFGCHVGGDTIGFVMKMEGQSFPETVRSLSGKLGIPLPTQRPTGTDPKQGEKHLLQKLHQEATEYYHSILLKHPQAQAARGYLKKRGIQPEMIEAFRLGFALPSWNHFQITMSKAGWSLPVLEKAGLIIARDRAPGDTGHFYDRFRNRLIFPILDLQEQVCGFGGRTLDDSTGPKYLNSPETLIFSKGRLLYGLAKARESIRQTGHLVVVEGYFDVIGAHQAGTTAVVATLGTALTPMHLQLIKRLTQKVKLIFDPDSAGVKATLRAVELIAPSGISAEVVQLPQGQDPDSFIRSHGKDAFTNLLTHGIKLMDFALEQCLTDPDIKQIDGKLRVIQSFLPVIRKIPRPVERGYYLKRLSEGLGVSEQHLLEEFRTQRTLKTDPIETKPTAISVSLPKEEEILIHLLLHQYLAPGQLLEAVPLEDFSDPRSAQVIGDLFKSQNKSGAIRLQDALQREATHPELVSLLTALSVREPDYEDLHQTMADCIRTVKLKKLKTAMKDLENQIRRAEQEGRSEGVRSLQGQLIGLQKRSSEVAGNLSYGMIKN